MKDSNEVIIFKVTKGDSSTQTDPVCDAIDLYLRQPIDDIPFDDLDFGGEVLAVTLYKGKRAVIINPSVS